MLIRKCDLFRKGAIWVLLSLFGFAGGGASGEIFYSGSGARTQLAFDLDEDGMMDLRLFTTTVLIGGDARESLHLGMLDQDYLYRNSSSTGAVHPALSEIGPAMSPAVWGYTTAMAGRQLGTQEWNARLRTGFVPMRMIRAEKHHYGWIGVQISVSGKVRGTVVDWAWELEPGKAILAGVADGSGKVRVLWSEPRRSASGGLVLGFDGHPGAMYIVERSPDMMQWEPWRTFEAPAEFEMPATEISGGATYFRTRRVDEG